MANNSKLVVKSVDKPRKDRLNRVGIQQQSEFTLEIWPCITCPFNQNCIIDTFDSTIKRKSSIKTKEATVLI